MSAITETWLTDISLTSSILLTTGKYNLLLYNRLSYRRGGNIDIVFNYMFLKYIAVIYL